MRQRRYEKGSGSRICIGSATCVRTPDWTNLSYTARLHRGVQYIIIILCTIRLNRTISTTSVPDTRDTPFSRFHINIIICIMYIIQCEPPSFSIFPCVNYTKRRRYVGPYYILFLICYVYTYSIVYIVYPGVYVYIITNIIIYTRGCADMCEYAYFFNLNFKTCPLVPTFLYIHYFCRLASFIYRSFEMQIRIKLCPVVSSAQPLQYASTPLYTPRLMSATITYKHTYMNAYIIILVHTQIASAFYHTVHVTVPMHANTRKPV